MFYYLLLNSSFNKKGSLKERLITTLIYGSVIYIVIHALISFTLQKNVISYFWLLFLIDCSAFFLTSDILSLTTSISKNSVLNNSNKNNDIIDEFILKTDHIKKNNNGKNTIDNDINDKNNSKIKKNVNFKKKNDIMEFDSDSPIEINMKNKNKNKKKKIKSIIKNNNKNEESELNLTLKNLESMDLIEKTKNITGETSSSIDEIKRNFLKKKLDDEQSDLGSDLDLDQFENSVMNDL